MRTVNIHEAKTHLSRLVDQAVKGEPFVIAKAGKPLVKVVASHRRPTFARLDMGSSTRRTYRSAVAGPPAIVTPRRIASETHPPSRHAKAAP